MIILTGFTGAGKTYLGSRLSSYLGMSFTDLDSEIEKREGRQITDIFKKQGENEFRILENTVLNECLRRIDTNSVFTVGGGTPCFYNQMELLKKHGLVIYLQLSPVEILRKLKAKQLSDRPVLAGLSNQQILKLYEQRRPYYEAAHLKIPLQWAKSPELLTMTLNLFTKQHPDLIYLHNFL